jgi:ribosomal protein L25 (general stress protein Ctc)
MKRSFKINLGIAFLVAAVIYAVGCANHNVESMQENPIEEAVNMEKHQDIISATIDSKTGLIILRDLI